MLPTTSDIEVKQIPISKIRVINRMRRTDENNVEDLKRSIKEINTWRKFQHREHEAVQEHILRIVDFLDDFRS